MAVVTEVPKYVHEHWEHLRKVDRNVYWNTRSEYMSKLIARDSLVNLSLDGDAHNLFKPDTPIGVKEEYNRLSTEIAIMNAKALDSEVEDVEALNLQFMKGNEEVATGWYQNAVGDLYHYDGVVWDTVPSERIQDLEFLGN